MRENKRLIDLNEKCHSIINEEDAEIKLTETLSILSSSEDRVSYPHLAQIWQSLAIRNDLPSLSEIDEPWEIGVSILASLIRIISPFEVHSIASQSLIFLKDPGPPHPVLCLMLCAWSLTQCPIEPKRWKRWQSILCETIRLFQIYRRDEWEVDLWVTYLMPAFLQVKLPSEACHVGILSGKIGTSLTLIADHPDKLDLIQRSLMNVIDIRQILLHPWSISRLNYVDSTISNPTCPLMFENLAWWSEAANCHDVVSSMDTSWSNAGICLLARESFKLSKEVNSPPEILWEEYFPHVSTMLLYSEKEGLQFLDNLLLYIVLPQTLRDWNNIPTNPINTIQLLCNLLVRFVQTNDRSNAKAILSRVQKLVQYYIPRSQVELIQNLIIHCPYPSLKSKLLDLLRPLARKKDCDELWEFLESHFFDKVSRFATENGQLSNISQLDGDVETYFSATSLILLRLIELHQWPPFIKESSVQDLLRLVARKLKEDEVHDQFNNYPIWTLLQCTLERLVEEGLHEW
jgi:hypothetical protein